MLFSITHSMAPKKRRKENKVSAYQQKQDK